MTAFARNCLFLFSLSGFIAIASCSNISQDVDNAEKGRIIHENSVAVVGPLLDARALRDSSQENIAASPVKTPTPEPSTSKVISKAESNPVSVAPSPSPSAEPSAAPTKKVKAAAAPQAHEENVLATGTAVSEKNKTSEELTAPEPKTPDITGTTVKGKIKFLDENKEAISIEGSIVVLKPLFESASVSTTREGQHHVVDMENKIYHPRYLAVNKHDTLVFVNKDKIKHNVFSSSGKNAFDLGTYGSGKQRSVNLGETGIVKVYCNIHPEMATFVSVNSDAAHTVTDENGYFQLNNIQGGEYEMHVWHIRGEKKMNIQVSDKADNYYQVNIDTSPVVVEDHKNKFGKEYSKNSALFEDEFY